MLNQIKVQWSLRCWSWAVAEGLAKMVDLLKWFPLLVGVTLLVIELYFLNSRLGVRIIWILDKIGSASRSCCGVISVDSVLRLVWQLVLALGSWTFDMGYLELVELKAS